MDKPVHNAFSTAVIYGPPTTFADTATVSNITSVNSKSHSTASIFHDLQKIQVPYQGQMLSGKPLLSQLDKWVSNGVIEPSAADAVKTLIKNRAEWSTSKLQQHVFVVMGAGSAMGPSKPLLRLGATVVALDLDGRPKVWEQLINTARKSPGARLVVPIRNTSRQSTNTQHFHFTETNTKLRCEDGHLLAERTGCNLLRDTPEIAQWLSALAIDGSPGFCSAIPNVSSLTLGQYA